MPDSLTAYFWSGDAIRSRSVGDVVLSSTLDVPHPPERLIADWQRELLRLDLAPGDVEALSLPRARVRWPDYRRCVQAMSDWMETLGLQDVLATSDIALMACRGAKYHFDGEQYGGAAFCNVFLSEDKGLDLHFPVTGHRLALTRGTAVIFDTGQPHAVIHRGSHGFEADAFGPEQDFSQLFLTWELPIEHAALARALRIAFDTDPTPCQPLQEEQVWLNGARVNVCPETGRWYATVDAVENPP